MSHSLVYATRKFTFSAAHRYWRSEWPAEENRRVFGNLTVAHGHNYVLEVTIRGAVDPETGMVMDLASSASTTPTSTPIHSSARVTFPPRRISWPPPGTFSSPSSGRSVSGG
jgi:hypothetical protein